MVNQDLKKIEDRYELDQIISSSIDADLYRAVIKNSNQKIFLWISRISFKNQKDVQDKIFSRLYSLTKYYNFLSLFGFTTDGYFFIESPLRLGQTLSLKVNSNREALRLWYSCIDEIEKLHEQGFVCGDLNLDSFWLSKDGKLKLFAVQGLLKPIDNIQDFSASLDLLYFLAPELKKGGIPTPASDIYSLAMIGFCLLNGEYPRENRHQWMFEGGISVNADILTGTKINTQENKWFIQLLDFILTKEPERRVQSISQLKNLITQFRSGNFIDKPLQTKENLDSEETSLAVRQEGKVLRYDYSKQINASDDNKGIESFDLTRKNNKKEQNLSLLDKDKIKKSYLKLFLLTLVFGAVLSVSVVFVFVKDLFSLRSFLFQDKKVLENNDNYQNPVLNEIEKNKILFQKLEAGETAFSLNEFISLAIHAKVYYPDFLERIHYLLIASLEKNFGVNTSFVVKKLLNSENINSFYKPFLKSLDVKLSLSERKEQIETIFLLDQFFALRLLSVFSLEDKNPLEWRNLLYQFLKENYDLKSDANISVAELIYTYSFIREVYSQDLLINLTKTLSIDALRRVLNLQDEKSSYEHYLTLLTEIYSRAEANNIERIVIDSLRYGNPSDNLKIKLINVLKGDYSFDFFESLSEWNSEWTEKVLTRLCLEDASNAQKLQIWKSLKKIPLDSAFLTTLKTAKVNWNENLVSLICRIDLYDELNPFAQKNIFMELSDVFEKNSEIIDAIINNKKYDFLTKFIEESSTKLKIHSLLKFLKIPDRSVKIATIKALSIYNDDIAFLRMILKNYNEEKDLEVRAVYERYFWVLKQNQ